MAEYLLIKKKVWEMIKYNNIIVLHFPKYEKYLMANKIREAGYELLEDIIIVEKKLFKKTTFSDMNVKHELLRQLVKLSFELKYISADQDKTAELKIDEVGKLIGAWIKQELGSKGGVPSLFAPED